MTQRVTFMLSRKIYNDFSCAPDLHCTTTFVFNLDFEQLLNAKGLVFVLRIQLLQEHCLIYTCLFIQLL